MGMLAAGILFLLAVSAQASESAGRGQAVPDEALRRIAAAVAQPRPLRLTTPAPTFRAEVRQHPWFRDVTRPWDFGGGGSPTAAPQAGRPATPALVSVDALPLLRRARSAWIEHGAREEVSKAIADFCATHECP
jgi:hypothetical protein